MSSGIQDFAMGFAARMTSEECRAAPDKEAFRSQAWEESVAHLTYAALADTMREAGPHFRLGVAASKVAAVAGGGPELQEMLVALCLIDRGANANTMEQVFEDMGMLA